MGKFNKNLIFIIWILGNYGFCTVIAQKNDYRIFSVLF